MVLPPNCGREQDVFGSHRDTPRHVVLTDVQPLGVLVEHGIDNVGKRFVGVKKPMPPGQQISLKPAQQRVLREHFHNAPVARELAAVGVLQQHVRHPGFLAHFVR